MFNLIRRVTTKQFYGANDAFILRTTLSIFLIGISVLLLFYINYVVQRDIDKDRYYERIRVRKYLVNIYKESCIETKYELPYSFTIDDYTYQLNEDFMLLRDGIRYDDFPVSLNYCKDEEIIESE